MVVFVIKKAHLYVPVLFCSYQTILFHTRKTKIIIFAAYYTANLIGIGQFYLYIFQDSYVMVIYTVYLILNPNELLKGTLTVHIREINKQRTSQ